MEINVQIELVEHFAKLTNTYDSAPVNHETDNFEN